MAVMSPGVRAALVTVGDELLLGRTVDTNAAWMGRELAARGVPVARQETVGDDEAEIRRALASAMSAADLVVVTGGLGPTPDDITRDAVAALLEMPLQEDPEVLADVRRRFLERGVTELPRPNRRVAQVPKGAQKLSNPLGTAPGLVMDVEGASVILLPGVPGEMKAIVREGLDALLRERFGGRLQPVWTRTVHTTGIPESLLSQQITDRLGQGAQPLGLAFLPKIHGVALRFTGEGMAADEAERHFETLYRTLDPLLAPWTYDAETGDLAQAVSEALRRASVTVAVAESCTGGLIAKRLTDVPGASDVFVGGIIAYSNDVKKAQLGVPHHVLDEQGAVSEAVARQMASGVAQALGAGAGVGITGVAGPGGGTEDKPVGTVWYAASVGTRVVARLERFPGNREWVRERSAQAALFVLLRMLDGRVQS